MHILPVFLLFASLLAPCHAGFENYLRKLENKIQKPKQVKDIDFIYLLNLDQRPEKLYKCMAQFAPFEIYPERISSIYGWTLTKDVLDRIGLELLPNMEMKLIFMTSELMVRCCRENCKITNISLQNYYGQTIFSSWLSLGAIGCTLSHLSAIKDGYDAGYETIWVLEDDIFVSENPHQLTDLMHKLDTLVGTDGWDVLYTDCSYECGKPTDPLEQALPWMWRPDVPLEPKVQEYSDMGEDFMKIGSRIGAHSLIIRRSGMKKILDFYDKHHIYVPYDHEIALVPDIRLFVTKKPIVTAIPGFSDTKNWAK